MDSTSIINTIIIFLILISLLCMLFLNINVYIKINALITKIDLLSIKNYDNVNTE